MSAFDGIFDILKEQSMAISSSSDSDGELENKRAITFNLNKSFICGACESVGDENFVRELERCGKCAAIELGFVNPTDTEEEDD